jgi:hypothetical protein
MKSEKMYLSKGQERREVYIISFTFFNLIFGILIHHSWNIYIHSHIKIIHFKPYFYFLHSDTYWWLMLLLGTVIAYYVIKFTSLPVVCPWSVVKYFHTDLISKIHRRDGCFRLDFRNHMMKGTDLLHFWKTP